MTTKDGHVLPANKSIQFRASCSNEQNSLVEITIDYTTSLNNTDATVVYLKTVAKII